MITRFAPSPTGPLHLGHAYSAILAHDMARSEGGQFLLRFDDLDQSRCRPEWEALILEDLQWLGLSWDAEPTRQTDNIPVYKRAMKTLARDGLLYPCSCKRKDIRAAASAAHEGDPPMGPDGVIYPGTCRDRPFSDRKPDDALRLNIAKAAPGVMADFKETGPAHRGEHIVTTDYLLTKVGDPVISRPGLPAAYNYAVGLDDLETGITHVIRGEDLFEATYLQSFYLRLQNLPTPTYHHHALIRDDQGKRLAKRDDARSISKYRADGVSPSELREMIGL